MASREARERRERIRNNMREFYNLESSPQREASADNTAVVLSSNNAGAAAGIDGPNFDVAGYAAELLQHATIKGLYEQDTHLRREIRELDGNLQELVYKNYSKFINATDTIKRMRDNVVDINDKLRTLSENVEKITAVSRTISGNLETHRSKIEEVLIRNRMLQKIKFLVELPSSMRKAKAEHRYTDAVKEWVAGDQVLTRHSNIASFHRTHEECRTIAKTIYRELEALVGSGGDDHNSSTDSLSLTMSTQAILKESTAEESMAIVRQAVFNMHQLSMTSIFTDADRPKDFASEILALMASQAESQLALKVDTIIKALCGELKASVAVDTKGCFEKLAKGLSVVKQDESFVQLKTSFAEFAILTENMLATVDKLDGTELTVRVMAAAQPHLVKCVDTVLPVLAETAASILHQIVLHQSEAADASRSSAEAAVVVYRVCEEAYQAIGGHLNRFVTGIKQFGTKYLTAPGHDQVRSFGRMVDEAAQGVLRKVLATLEKFTEYIPPLNIESKDNDGVESVADSRFIGAYSVLVAALLSKQFATFQIEGFGTTGSEKSSGIAMSAADVMQLQTALQGAFADTTRRHVSHFIVLVGEHFSSLLLEEYIGHASADPAGPHQTMQLMLVQWGSLHAVARHWFPDGHGRMDLAAGGHARTESGGEHSIPKPTNASRGIPTTASYVKGQQDVSRMLTKPIGALSILPRTLDAKRILDAIIVHSLVSLQEHVRLVTFSKSQFQQLQVDLSYILQQMIPNAIFWMKDEVRFVNIVNEIAANAYSRCVDRAAPLAAPIVEKLARSDN